MHRAQPMGVRYSEFHFAPLQAPNTSSSRMRRPAADSGDRPHPSSSMEYQLKKYLLLLATLVATVTYAAGLNPPGGSWLEDDAAAGELAGDSILRETNYMRYIVFYCFNAISFAASLVVSLLLLLLHKQDATGRLIKLTRVVMVVDLLALMGSYAAGTSHDRFTTVCATALVVATAAYVIFAVPTFSTRAAETSADDLEKHEILMVLAIFVATVAYVAGLNPPGGFWRSTLLEAAGNHRNHHTAGDPVLQALHPIRYKFFFFSNATAFIASLLAITFTVHYEKLSLKSIKVPLYGLVIVAILGLGGAYAAGSCRDSKHTTYVLALVVPVLLCIFLQRFLVGSVLKLPCYGTGPRTGGGKAKDDNSDLGKIREFIQLLAILAATVAYQAGVDPPGGVWAENGEGHSVGDPILLTTHPGRFKVFFYFNSAAFVASLVIMVMLQSEFLVRRHALEAVMILDLFSLIGAYAAGSCRDTSTSIYTLAMAGGVLIYVVIHIVFFTLDPSSGKDKKSDEGNETKNSEIATKGSNPNEDNKKSEQGNQTKKGVVATEGKNPSEDNKKSEVENEPEKSEISTSRNPNEDNKSEEQKKKDQQEKQREERTKKERLEKQREEQTKKDRLEKKREVLLLLAILAATLTYQAGLTPPGGLWENAKFGHRAGFPVLLDKYPRRYKAFFYCNTGSFMASVALIVLLLNPNLYGPGIKCYALFVCMVAGMFSLIGAYAAGSSLHLRTSIVVLILVLAVFAAVVYVAIIRRHQGDAKTNNPEDPKPKDTPAGDTSSNTNAVAEDKKPDNSQEAAMYLMLVGILAASVTYLTGLKPPGGLWREDSDGHSAGNPVLYDIDKHRYNAFFYSNSTSFMASVTVIVLLLPRMLRDNKENGSNKMPLWPMHTAMFLDMLALLGAYAAGSAREWCTSKNVILLLLPVMGFVALLFFWKKGKTTDGTQHADQGAPST